MDLNVQPSPNQNETITPQSQNTDAPETSHPPTGPPSGSSEFSGLVSYFSSQQELD